MDHPNINTPPNHPWPQLRNRTIGYRELVVYQALEAVRATVKSYTLHDIAWVVGGSERAVRDALMRLAVAGLVEKVHTGPGPVDWVPLVGATKPGVRNVSAR